MVGWHDALAFSCFILTQYSKNINVVQNFLVWTVFLKIEMEALHWSSIKPNKKMVLFEKDR